MTNRYSWERVFVFWGIAIPSLLSCTRVTDLRPEGRGEVVVVCVLTEEATQSLTLDLTDIASPEDRAALSEAVITLFDETAGQEVGSFQKDGGNDWQLEYAAIPEHKYRLQIFIPGREEISATTTMPAKSNVAYRLVFAGYGFFEREEDDRELGMQYSISSLPDNAVWVMGVNRVEDTGEEKVAAQIATSLAIADPFNVTDEIFHGLDYLDREELEFLEEIQKTGIASFYGNVEGHPVYDKVFRIPSTAEVDRNVASNPPGYFSVAGRFDIDYKFDYTYWKIIDDETTGFILFLSPSLEYDRFLRDILAKKKQQDKWGDYASIFSRNNIYSNIQNGLGVFGARTKQKLPWNKTIHWHSILS